MRDRTQSVLALVSAKENRGAEFLKIGDLVSLYSETADGYLRSDGFGDLSLKVRPSKEDLPSIFRDCVFRVVCQQQYKAQKNLAKLLDRFKTTREDFEESDHLSDVDKKSLRIAVRESDIEVNANAAEIDRLSGNVVTFGQTIQLLHVKSGSYVTLFPRRMADIENNNTKIELHRTGTEGSHLVVRPRYKLKGEGEDVRVGDVVVFASAKHGDVLHESKTALPDGQLEVNGCTDEGTAWKTHSFSSFDATASGFLKGGDIVRLFHKEAEGFLNSIPASTMSSTDTAFLRYEPSEHSESATSMWEVEFADKSMGGSVEYGVDVRFRRLGTVKYLMMADRQGTEADNIAEHESAQVMDLVTSENAPLEASTFQIIPTFDTTGRIALSSVLRIKHATSDLWLHASPKFLDGGDGPASDMMGDSTVRRVQQEILCTSHMFDEDAFVFMPVPGDEIDDLYHISSLVPRLVKFVTETLSKGTLPDSKVTYPIINVLKDLILACTVSDDTNPLTREGLPVPFRQNAMRETKAVEVLIDMLRLPFAKCGLTLGDVKSKAEHRHIFRMCQLTYRLLKQIMKGNRANGLYLVDQIDFMQSQLGYQLKTADTLMEMFKNNRELLDRVKESQINYFVELILSKGNLERYVKFLGALLTYDGQGHARNQDTVFRLLILAHPEALIRTRLNNGVVEVFAPPQPQPGGKWTPLSQFLRSADDELRSYYERSIEMFAKLCLGRRTLHARTINDTLIDYGAAEAMAGDASLPDTLRRHVVDLLLTQHVDAEPQGSVTDIDLTRVWDSLSDDLPTNEMEPPVYTNRFEQLKKIVLQVLGENRTQSPDNVARNEMVTSFLQVLRNLFAFGFFSDLAELSDAVNLVIDICEERPHAPRSSTLVTGVNQASAQVGAHSHRNDPFAFNEKTATLMASKEEAVAFLHLVYDVRMNRMISRFLLLYKDVVEGRVEQHDAAGLLDSVGDLAGAAGSAAAAAAGSAFRFAQIGGRAVGGLVSGIVGTALHTTGLSAEGGQERGSSEGQPLIERRTRRTGTLATSVAPHPLTPVEERLSEIFSEFDFSEKLRGVLLTLLRYESPRLSTSALELLVRINSQRMRLHDGVRNVQLLVDTETVNAYRLVQRLLAEIRKMTSPNMTAEQEKKCAEFLDRFIELCTTTDSRGRQVPHYENQHIFRNLNAHRAVVNLLHLPFSNKLPEEQGRREVFLRCYQFLRWFCYKSPDNQELLYEHVDFFLSQMGVKLKAADTINEIFKDNRTICSRVRERLISQFVELIAERGQFPRYLAFLRIIVKCNNIAIKRNQNLVLKHMLAHKARTMVLFFGEGGRAERNRLIADGEHERDPEGIVNYHRELINLLTDCAAGKNFVTESKCQALLPFQEVVENVLDSHSIPEVRAAYLRFLEETYVNVEKPLPYVRASPSLQEVVRVLANALPQLPARLQSTARNDVALVDFVSAAGSLYVRSLMTNVVTEDHLNNGEFLDAVRAYVDALVSVRSQVPADAMEKPMQALSAIYKRGLAGAETSRDQMKGLLEDVPGHARLPSPTPDDRKTTLSPEKADIVDKLPEFASDAFSDTTALDREFFSLVDTMYPFRMKDATADDRAVLSKIIEQLADPNMETRLRVWGLRTLRYLVLTRRGEDEDEVTPDMERMQIILDDLGASTLFVRLVSGTEDKQQPDALVEQALKLGCALLEGGNLQVQENLYEFFITTGESRFFIELGERLRRGVLEAKERRKQQKRREEREELRRSGLVTMGDDEEEAEFKATSYVQDVLRLLQLLCEGHNTRFQRYLLRQTASAKSVDLVLGTVEYVIGMERYISPETIEVVKQGFESLAEYMQGPCPETQNAVVSTKIIETVNRILRLTIDEEHEAALDDLKSSSMTSLLSLLEGNTDPFVPRRMMASLDIESIVENMNDDYETWCRDPEDEDAQESLDGSFQYYILLRVLLEFDNSKRIRRLFNDETSPILGLKKYKAETGRIEVVRGKTLERVYFRIPPVCRHLTDRAKQEILYKVDRTNHTQKLQDFYSRIDDLRFGMEHQERLSKNERVQQLAAKEPLWKTIAFLNGIFINLMLILFWSRDCFAVDDGSGNIEEYICELDISRGAREVVYFFGAVQMLLTLFIFVVVFGNKALIVVRKGWKEHFGESGEFDFDEAIKEHDLKGPGNVGMFYLRSGYFLLQDVEFTWYFMYFLTSIFGMVQPFWYIFHLMEVVNRSITLQNVFLAVTYNGRSLLQTALLGVIFIYFFGVVGFIYFPGKFQTGESDDGSLLTPCDTVYKCFVIIFDGGLRTGDAAETLNDLSWNDDDAGGRILFSIMFFILVTTILLNLIFGIIIDTFGELRTVKAEIEDDIQNNCFISGIERFTLDRDGEGFEKHIKEDQNMWNYAFFIIHLRYKNSDDYNGSESFVAELLADGDLSFFPVGRAMALNSDDEVSIEEKVDHLSQGIGIAFDNLSKRFDAIENMVATMLPDESDTLTLPGAVGGPRRPSMLTRRRSMAGSHHR